MSKALLKRCMELVTETPPTIAKSSKKSANKSNKNQQSRPHVAKASKRLGKIALSTEDAHGKFVIDFCRSWDPPERQAILIAQHLYHFSDKRAAAKKLTVRQVQNRLKSEKDRTEENVKRLLALDRSLQLNDETKDLMLKRARTGHYVIPEKVEKEEEDVFTKEDFEKFEREYFPH